jgi:hypothetical protein
MIHAVPFTKPYDRLIYFAGGVFFLLAAVWFYRKGEIPLRNFLRPESLSRSERPLAFWLWLVFYVLFALGLIVGSLFNISSLHSD